MKCYISHFVCSAASASFTNQLMMSCILFRQPCQLLYAHTVFIYVYIANNVNGLTVCWNGVTHVNCMCLVSGQLCVNLNYRVNYSCEKIKFGYCDTTGDITQ